MKTTNFILALLVIGLASCHNEGDTIKAFIPGTYVKTANSSYSTAWDTLKITPLAGNAFLIGHFTGYQPSRNGKALLKRFKKEKQTAVYDPQKQVLEETTSGRMFLFDSAGRVLLVGPAKYQKIN